MNVFLIGILILTFVLVISRRITALINTFILQSFLLFSMTLFVALSSKNIELYIIAAFIFLLKVILIPYFLFWIVKKINIEENLGLFINPMLSLIIIILLSYSAYHFADNILNIQNKIEIASFTISLTVILTGVFIMVFRIKAIAQVVGLMVMENGLFLAAIALCGNMPFFLK